MEKFTPIKKIIISALIFSFLVLPIFAKAQVNVHLRIEGENNNICDANVTAETALDVVYNGAGICDNYTYSVQDYGWGAYLNKINAEEAHGSVGWLYFVNYEMPMVGAADYVLSSGDEVLWAFGDFDWKLTRLTAGSEVETGNNLEARAEYFDDSSWKPLPGATIYFDWQTLTTNVEGKANLVINNPGTYQAYAQKSGYIRSNRLTIKVNAAPGPPPSGPAPSFSGGDYYPFPMPTPTPTSTPTSTPETVATSTPETAEMTTGMVAGAETSARIESLEVKIAQFQTQLIKIAELQAQLIQLLEQLIQELQAQVFQLQRH
jgi:hypothetical protein